MTQYDETVERQRLLLEAEDWAMGVKSLHVHCFTSMWYDTRPQDTNCGKENVTDVEYNCGLIKRSKDGKHIHTFGKALKGNALIDAYVRNT